MTGSLISDEARAMIGQVLDQRQGVVIRKEFQRWAASVGDLNPLYFDEQAAKEQGHPDVVMPPLFISQVMHDYATLDSLRPDGIPAVGGGLNIPLPERRMAGGNGCEFHAPVYPGDVLTATSRLTDLVEKNGRSGTFVLVTMETDYENQRGDVVVTTTASMIAR